MILARRACYGELNAEFKAWEEKRKEVKTAVMSPYEQFEAVYKDCISDAYKAADKDLKQKIDEVEQQLKTEKLSEVKSYFEEYLASKSIDFITRLNQDKLIDKFETRKVVFHADAVEYGEKIFRKALEFELLWLKSKRRYYSGIKAEDENRIAMLEERLNG